MKIRKKDLIEALRILEETGRVYLTRKKLEASIERTYQIWKEYKRTGKIPEIERNIRRPKKQINPDEKPLNKHIKKEKGRKFTHNGKSKFISDM